MWRCGAQPSTWHTHTPQLHVRCGTIDHACARTSLLLAADGFAPRHRRRPHPFILQHAVQHSTGLQGVKTPSGAGHAAASHTRTPAPTCPVVAGAEGKDVLLGCRARRGQVRQDEGTAGHVPAVSDLPSPPPDPVPLHLLGVL